LIFSYFYYCNFEMPVQDKNVNVFWYLNKIILYKNSIVFCNCIIKLPICIVFVFSYSTKYTHGFNINGMNNVLQIHSCLNTILYTKYTSEYAIYVFGSNFNLQLRYLKAKQGYMSNWPKICSKITVIYYYFCFIPAVVICHMCACVCLCFVSVCVEEK